MNGKKIWISFGRNETNKKHWKFDWNCFYDELKDWFESNRIFFFVRYRLLQTIVSIFWFEFCFCFCLSISIPFSYQNEKMFWPNEKQKQQNHLNVHFVSIEKYIHFLIWFDYSGLYIIIYQIIFLFSFRYFVSNLNGIVFFLIALIIFIIIINGVLTEEFVRI